MLAVSTSQYFVIKKTKDLHCNCNQMIGHCLRTDMLQMGTHRIIMMIGLILLLTMASLWFEAPRFRNWKHTMAPYPAPAVNRSEMIPRSFKQTKKVDLLIIVLSASSNFRQRTLIRQTWWTSCKKITKVSCWFFTDKLESIDNKETRKKVRMEQREYDDIIFSPVGRGIQFGLRVLHLMQWGKNHYDFRFILRIDDDIMLCLDHLLWDLPNFPPTNVHYGYLTCSRKDFTFIDDATTMYSSDVIDKYLSQKADKILCHPFADAQVDLWEKALGLNSTIIHPDNDRIHQQPPASYDENMKQKRDICDSYIAVHGIYKYEMLEFWKRRGGGKFTKYSRKPASHFCPHAVKINNSWYKGIHMPPKPCYLKPRWNMESYKRYPSREQEYSLG